MLTADDRITVAILGSLIDAVRWDDAVDRITRWAARRESRYVCACSVHSLVTASRDPAFREIINSADMAVPDGMPVAWLLRKAGFPQQQRVNGPDLMWRLCESAAATGQALFFYGGSSRALVQLQTRLNSLMPALKIAGMNSPPYAPQSEGEDRTITALINASGAAIVFVALGCPKQEQWIAQHRGKIHAVMIGVGAALDYHAGTLKRAPRWMQESGLEWLYRLMKEPRRLWRRYLTVNAMFLLRIAQELLKEHRHAVAVASARAPVRLRVGTDAGQRSGAAEANEVEKPTR